MDRMNDFETLTLIQSIRKVLTIVHGELSSRIIGYLIATGNPVGLLLNFGQTKVHVKRNVRGLDAA